jgi:Fe-S-cluster containining protein
MTHGVPPRCTGKDNLPAADAAGAAERDEVRVDLPVLGLRYERRLPVDDAPATLADVVPVAWQLCDDITRITLEQARLAGRNIPCKKGCSACCRYMVPLSVPEAFRLWQDIQGLPQLDRIQLLGSFQTVALRIVEAARAQPPVRPDEADTASDDVILSAAGKWYARLNLACPFLDADACSIYDRRPVACRKYHVVTDARFCDDVASGLGRRLAVPVGPVQALCQLAAELEQSEPQAVLLPMAPLWAASHLDRAQRTWPRRAMIERLVQILTDQAERSQRLVDDARAHEAA